MQEALRSMLLLIKFLNTVPISLSAAFREVSNSDKTQRTQYTHKTAACVAFRHIHARCSLIRVVRFCLGDCCRDRCAAVIGRQVSWCIHGYTV